MKETDLNSAIGRLAGVSSTNIERKHVVACALELIKADLRTEGTQLGLGDHMDNLSGYADKIEAALNKE